MILALLLALQAAAPPTVGDTLWLDRIVQVPAGAEVRAAPWEPEGEFGLLGRPLVRQEGDRAMVSYPAVAWSAGTHAVLVPGPIIIHSNGVTDSLAAESRIFVVASVLPADPAPERLPIQPEAGIVAERVTSPWPVVLAVFMALALFAPVAWWWRRRGPVRRVSLPPSAARWGPLAEWVEAGESRAVAALAARGLRGAITTQLKGTAPGIVTSRLVRAVAEQRSAWPAEEIGQVLLGLDAAQFGVAASPQVDGLAERASSLRRLLEGTA